jgi:hypothetical protein
MADQWYYADNGQQVGPVPFARLRTLAEEGVLRPGDLVWTDTMSAWAPASTVRGLFAAPTTPPASDIPSVVPAPKSRAPRRFGPDDYDDDRYHRRFERNAGGMSATAKVCIIVGVAGFLGLLMVGGIVLVVVMDFIETEEQQQRYMANGGGPGWQGGGGGPPPMTPPLPPMQQITTIPAGKTKYVVQLNGEGSQDARQVYFAKGKRVTVKVDTTNWPGAPGGFEPDVDLYVYDATTMQLLTFDNGPFKDCWAQFDAPRSGNYIIQVHLCAGQSATCTVQY